MKLTKEQIEYLFAFCIKHFVQYYDVQVELVDHLANAVELKMKNDPKLTFEKAVEQVHTGFGVMGFAPLVAEKQRMAEKQSRRLFFQLFKEQFKWPKILLFFIITAAIYTICSITLISTKSILVAVLISSFIIYSLAISQLQLLAKKSGKKFLIIEFSWISSFIMVPSYFLNSFRILIEKISLYFFTSGFTIFCISVYLCIYILLVLVTVQTLLSIGNKVRRQYPEVFSVSK
ncbi:MAG: hypothetical protein ACTHKY_09500 [Ginsengibacter sp.]